MRKSEMLILQETLGEEWKVSQFNPPTLTIRFYRRVLGFFFKWRWHHVGYCLRERLKTIYCPQSELEHAIALELKLRTLGYEVELTVD